MSEDISTPDNVVPFAPQAESTETPETPAAEQTGASEQTQPPTMREIIDNVDITNISGNEIVSDIVAGIQQLAMRATIGLGILERIALRDSAGNEEAPAETSATTPSEGAPEA